MRPTSSHFDIHYQITASSQQEAQEKAEKVSVEQSVEMPVKAVPQEAKPSLPKVKSITLVGDRLWETSITFPVSLIGDDIVQFLNILYGNISLYSDIKVIDVTNHFFESLFRGPAYGIDGIRQIVGVNSRPLSCTALKPIGLSPYELAKRATAFAENGIDIIKDDHGLANQHSAGFEARTKACTTAVHKAAQKTGKQTLYFPNITATPLVALERVEMALEIGAHGVLICPQLTGISLISEIRKKYDCPIMAHPSFSGSFVSHKTSGISLSLYYGKIWRALGADAVIFPNPGGRFKFSRKKCADLHNTLTDIEFPSKPSFPVPAGGIQLSSVQKFREMYGDETIFLIGGSLYEHSGGIEKATRIFQKELL